MSGAQDDLAGKAGDDLRLLSVVRAAFTDPPQQIGVAVSGGGDSMALLDLCDRAFPGQIRAVTVDHGLRPESAGEAAGVARFCAARGIPHETLRWLGPAPTGNLMDQARRARLALMADWAAGQGIGDIFLGHTADDQAESFLMNLGRAAGLDGLCGLRPRWDEAGIRWHRPLLAVSRAELRAYLMARDLAWVDDPSNDNPRFARVRARRAMRALRPLGITAERLVETMSHLAEARQALGQAVQGLWEREVRHAAGALEFPLSAMQEAPSEIRRRLVLAVLHWINREDYPPRAVKVEALTAALLNARPATLAGVRFRFRKGLVLASREPRAVRGPVPQAAVWDRRWKLVGPDLPGATISALGAAGLAQCPDARTFGPREALITTPALWLEGRLIAAPLAGLGPQWHAETLPCPNMFILSH